MTDSRLRRHSEREEENARATKGMRRGREDAVISRRRCASWLRGARAN